MIKNKKAIVTIVTFICILLTLSNFAFAINTGAYSNIYTNDGKQSSIQNIGSVALGIVQTVGMAVAIIMLVVLGIKYIISSPEDKATIKDKAVMYVTGAVIIFAASGLVGIIANWASNELR